MLGRAACACKHVLPPGPLPVLRHANGTTGSSSVPLPHNLRLSQPAQGPVVITIFAVVAHLGAAEWLRCTDVGFAPCCRIPWRRHTTCGARTRTGARGAARSSPRPPASSPPSSAPSTSTSTTSTAAPATSASPYAPAIPPDAILRHAIEESVAFERVMCGGAVIGGSLPARTPRSPSPLTYALKLWGCVSVAVGEGAWGCS